MLFWICIILIAIGIILWKINYDYSEVVETLMLICLIFGMAGATISSCVFALSHSNVNGQITALQTKYDSLVYQLENDVYDNDNDLGKRELYTDIQTWNVDLAWLKEAQDDFWIGIFIPDIYDQFEYIELK